MNIRNEDPPADADGSRYKTIIRAAQGAGGVWVAIDRDGVKDSPAQLRKRLERAACQVGVEIQVEVAARTAHIRIISAAAQPAKPDADEPEGGDDACELRAAEASQRVDGDKTLAWAGFWRVVTCLVGDCAMRRQTLEELAENQTLTKTLLADVRHCEDDPEDDDDHREWTPDQRAVAERQIVLVERALRRMQCDPIDDPHPAEMTQLLTAFEGMENWLWGHLHMSSAERYRVALKLGREWKPEQVYNAVRTLMNTPCEPTHNDAKSVALRDVISDPDGLSTGLERILQHQVTA